MIYAAWIGRAIIDLPVLNFNALFVLLGIFLYFGGIISYLSGI
jgi:hypothetical protein